MIVTKTSLETLLLKLNLGTFKVRETYKLGLRIEPDFDDNVIATNLHKKYALHKTSTITINDLSVLLKKYSTICYFAVSNNVNTLRFNYNNIGNSTCAIFLNEIVLEKLLIKYINRFYFRLITNPELSHLLGDVPYILPNITSNKIEPMVLLDSLNPSAQAVFLKINKHDLFELSPIIMDYVETIRSSSLEQLNCKTCVYSHKRANGSHDVTAIYLKHNISTLSMHIRYTVVKNVLKKAVNVFITLL